jgi:hypothetical protein
MIVPGSVNPLLLKSAAAAGGFQVSRSLRFNASDSAYLSRTPAVAGNRQTWTWSGWVKRSALGSRQAFFSNLNSGATLGFVAEFTSSDTLDVYDYSSTYQARRLTTQVFRDTSAWYHILIQYDSTNLTATNRFRVHVNGTQITAYSTSTDPTLNGDGTLNTAVETDIGRAGAFAAFYFSGYLANVHFIDGQALTPSSFTETDATTGQLIPKAYTGSYGTNGFYLKFDDNSSNTASTLGKDTSGNSNNWTPNNLSVTAGAGNDSLVDSPTNGSQTDTGVGGEVRGNYATFNPLASDGTMSNGNLQLATSGSGESSGINSIGLPMSGKWYWEVTMDTIGTDPYTGITDGASRTSLGNATVAYRGNGIFYSTPTATNPSTAASYTTGDIIGLAFNADSLSLAFYKNGVIQGTTTNIASRQYFTLCYCYAAAQRTINFGQRPFAYTAPSGFKALCTQNLPAPLVTKSNTVMDVVLYTGNGSTQTISGLGFSPDLVWSKARSIGYGHNWFDSVRGVNKYIASDATSAESNLSPNGLTAFNSDGWTESAVGGYNTNGTTYVAWAWDAGTSTVSNTQGSITSQVRANPTAGFSVVTAGAGGYFGGSVGHGLGVAPEFIIVKDRNGVLGWRIYHKSLGNNGYLDFTTAAAGSLSGLWQVSSTVFGSNQGFSSTAVAYCFAPVVGYSSVGSYVGNGSSDGVFVYTGFRPRFILVKNATSAYDWRIHDTARDTYNVAQTELFPNGSYAEAQNSAYYYDILSNGFKLRTSDIRNNGSGDTYIYYAVAESPFNYSRAR